MTEDLYKIGAVAKRTGITPECLRAWERRYGLLPAERIGKTRFYSAAQVDRLLAVKALLDQGDSISEVVGLDEDELGARLRVAPHSGRGSRGGDGAPRLGLVGGPLVKAHREALGARANVVAKWVTLETVQALEGALPALDAVFVHLPSLTSEPIDCIRNLFPKAQVAAAYRFTTKQDLAQLQAAGVPLLPWPADWQAVEEMLAAMSFDAEDDDGARLYSDDQLDHIDRMADRAPCECPRHLAELVAALNALDDHGDRCDGTDDHQPLQTHLRLGRAQLEQALRRLVERHGLLVAPN